MCWHKSFGMAFKHFKSIILYKLFMDGNLAGLVFQVWKCRVIIIASWLRWSDGWTQSLCLALLLCDILIFFYTIWNGNLLRIHQHKNCLMILLVFSFIFRFRFERWEGRGKHIKYYGRITWNTWNTLCESNYETHFLKFQKFKKKEEKDERAQQKEH